MTTVEHILDSKGRGVFSVGLDAMVLDALKLMAEADIGSVMVMDGERIAGIFTERQYARRVFLAGRASPVTPVREVMEPDVICVRPGMSTEDCMALMSEKRLRHLPVVKDGELLGLVSIGDLLQSAIADREFHIDQLVEYVGH
ncbi:CBS domain-containing protein [Aliiruegeria sabulilitoris]|uniref:CBS domain-containing protein n=1 Tax=Aliiruegeria sabulilitoris TaxID=1510458 RepID=UPI000835C281|nr:CBS domain-containing protein [Aliiruegeria sabulilitoris]NDR57372.1 CBS domain-containing protein [Pseudoruegeria sp. M32A2M]